MAFPARVKIVEVGPRDGLQNERINLATSTKISFIDQLSKTGLSVIEATSFVSPKWIPNLADHLEVFKGITQQPGVSYPVFVPNLRGFERALDAGVREVAIFSTPSETFCHRNVNCTVAENLAHVREIVQAAQKDNVKVRGYISCVLGCPYEGEIKSQAVADVASKLHEMGCYEISLGDTIGVGTPLKTQQLLEIVLQKIPLEVIAVHFHNTYGQALTNIYVALQNGVTVIDSSVSGLGGCPYAKGASGNVATEDVLYMLNGMGIETGVDLNALVQVGQFITHALGHASDSKVNQAMRS